MYKFVIPLGITTFIFLVLTLLSGLHIIKVKLKMHRILGFVTLFFALCHAGLVIYLTYF